MRGILDVFLVRLVAAENVLADAEVLAGGPVRNGSQNMTK
jgi:hypothetical protein